MAFENSLAVPASTLQRKGLIPMSRTAFYQALRSGSIPTVKVGGRILIPRAWLNEKFGEQIVSEALRGAA